jgi:hypothetical protein
MIRPLVLEISVRQFLQFRQAGEHRCKIASHSPSFVSVGREAAGSNKFLLDARFGAADYLTQLLSQHLFNC